LQGLPKFGFAKILTLQDLNVRKIGAGKDGQNFSTLIRVEKG
jgi:hypothetical protein